MNARAYENIKTGLTETVREYTGWIQVVHQYIQ